MLLITGLLTITTFYKEGVNLENLDDKLGIIKSKFIELYGVIFPDSNDVSIDEETEFKDPFVNNFNKKYYTKDGLIYSLNPDGTFNKYTPEQGEYKHDIWRDEYSKVEKESSPWYKDMKTYILGGIILLGILLYINNQDPTGGDDGISFSHIKNGFKYIIENIKQRFNIFTYRSDEREVHFNDNVDIKEFNKNSPPSELDFNTETSKALERMKKEIYDKQFPTVPREDLKSSGENNIKIESNSKTEGPENSSEKEELDYIDEIPLHPDVKEVNTKLLHSLNEYIDYEAKRTEYQEEFNSRVLETLGILSKRTETLEPNTDESDAGSDSESSEKSWDHESNDSSDKVKTYDSFLSYLRYKTEIENHEKSLSKLEPQPSEIFTDKEIKIERYVVEPNTDDDDLANVRLIPELIGRKVEIVDSIQKEKSESNSYEIEKFISDKFEKEDTEKFFKTLSSELSVNLNLRNNTNNEFESDVKLEKDPKLDLVENFNNITGKEKEQIEFDNLNIKNNSENYPTLNLKSNIWDSNKSKHKEIIDVEPTIENTLHRLNNANITSDKFKFSGINFKDGDMFYHDDTKSYIKFDNGKFSSMNTITIDDINTMSTDNSPDNTQDTINILNKTITFDEMSTTFVEGSSNKSLNPHDYLPIMLRKLRSTKDIDKILPSEVVKFNKENKLEDLIDLDDD
jgi:hypothetical protein